MCTVIIMSYNCEATVSTSLKNIKFTNTLKYLIVDDCSSDNTFSEIELFFKCNFIANSNISYYRNEVNLGTVESLRKALQLVDTKYVKLIGIDDFVDTDLLSDIVLIDNFDVLLSPVKFSGDVSRVENLDTHNKYTRRFSKLPNSMKFICLLSANNLLAVSAVYRTRALKVAINNIRNVRLIEDWPIWLWLSSQSSTVFLWVERCFTEYHLSGSQVTQNKIYDKVIHNDLLQINSLKEHLMHAKYNLFLRVTLHQLSRIMNSLLFR